LGRWRNFLSHSAGEVRRAGARQRREDRVDALLLTDPELILPGPMFGMSAGGIGGRS